VCGKKLAPFVELIKGWFGEFWEPDKFRFVGRCAEHPFKGFKKGKPMFMTERIA